MIFRRSLDVPALNNYKDYRPFLCRDFEFRCAYCLRYEFFFGGGEAAEIDHFRPRHLFPALLNDYQNLYWSCRKCNAIKGGKWPGAAQVVRGLRFLDPRADDADDHWQTHADGTLTPLTPTGQYTVRHIMALMRADLAPVVRAGLQAELDAAATLLAPPTFSL